MIIQTGILDNRFINLDLVSIVVSWVTSPCKSIFLLQLLIKFFLLIFSQRNKKCFNCGERGHSYKECASLYRRGGGKGGGRGEHGGSGQGGGCGGHAHHVILNFYLKHQNEINCLSFIS